MSPTWEERWEEAAPLVAMALSEVGYPVKLVGRTALHYPEPIPYDVLRKAMELAGIGDMSLSRADHVGWQWLVGP